jgi:DNA-binding NtrC family response regulator
MSSLRLSTSETAFFEAVSRCAFTNPFSDERRTADLRAVGLPSGSWEDALARLLEELDRRLAGLTLGEGALDVRRFRGAEAALVRSGVLFRLFHRQLDGLDALIRREIEEGGLAPEAPCAHAAYESLSGCGFEREEAERYVAFFYQMRRAFYFISHGLVGDSPCMTQLRKRLWDNIFTHDVRWYEQGLWNRMEDFSTLLLGETGTGKGAAASALGRSGFIPYVASKRRFAESFTRAFVSINLSQFPESLIESELFGHRKGAFTGAVERFDGVFARCSPHGAIFLDEIGDASARVQIKLLQVLQQRTFSPVGGHEVLRFEGRVIAATNRDLAALRRTGAFRDDFFYRLCSDQIVVPPLRARLRETPSELETLVRHILARVGGAAADETLARVLRALSEGAGHGYAWPGNVRELEQAVRSVLLTGAYGGDRAAADDAGDWRDAMARGELTVQALTAAYCKQLYAAHGSYGEVARRTGLDWRTVKRHVGA